MATLFDPNRAQTRLNQMKLIDTVWYHTVLVQEFLNGPRFWTIFHDQAVPVIGWYGSMRPKPDGLGRFREPCS